MGTDCCQAITRADDIKFRIRVATHVRRVGCVYKRQEDREGIARFRLRPFARVRDIPQIGLVHGVKFPREMKKIAITPSGTCNFFALQGRCSI